MKKAFTQLSKTKIKEVDSELSDSESEDESQHFQYDEGGFSSRKSIKNSNQGSRNYSSRRTAQRSNLI